MLLKMLTTSFLIIFILVLVILMVWGLEYRPEFEATYINPGQGSVNPVCQKERITCNTDADCSKCIDNIEMKCVDITRTDDQSKNYGKGGKYCLPEKPYFGCNAKNGGIWTWTGWSDTERMEWDCLCTYPQIAGGPGCENLNANVCVGGEWNYDATTASEPPSPMNCNCPVNHHLLSTQPKGVPLCIPHIEYTCDGKKSCESMYSNSVFIS